MKPTFISHMEVVAVSIVFVGCSGPGMAQDPDQALHDWQVRRLMQPLPHELQKERSGSVYIYDGLTGKEVETGLDSNFERIQNMMFVGTVKTDARGEPLRDADTGRLIQESGGCSNPD
jgi:hypothetical protein